MRDDELLRASHLDRKGGHGGLHPAQDLAGPELFGEQCQEAVLEVADRAEQIVPKQRVICIHAHACQFSLHRRVSGSHQGAGPDSKGFTGKSLDKSGESIQRGCGKNEGMPRGFFFERDSVQAAIFTDPIDMSKKIERPRLIAGERRQRSRPDAGCIDAARRFAALDLH